MKYEYNTDNECITVQLHRRSNENFLWELFEIVATNVTCTADTNGLRIDARVQTHPVSWQCLLKALTIHAVTIHAVDTPVYLQV